MNNKNFKTYFDCGSSRIRAGSFNNDQSNNNHFIKSKFLFDHLDMESEIQKIVSYLEKNINEYIEDVNLMIDSPKMYSIGISVSKKLEGSKLKQEDVKFLVRQANQQILKHYKGQDITHIIIDSYKIDGIEHTVLPKEINCNVISLDILFICIPTELVNYYKKYFFKLNISVNQIVCSSYIKSLNYRENLSLESDVLFIDIGFNKTSIICYKKKRITHLNILPIGGNHISKDISKVLKIDLNQAENIKLNLGKESQLLNDKEYSLELLQKIIFARIEEILELSVKSIKSNLANINQFKMVLMGEGSKILDNKYKDKISFSNEIDFLEETTEDICQSGLKFEKELNKSEVVLISKKQLKQAFFEKLFHFFK